MISSAEMKQRAELFVKEYKDETSEKSQAQNYWRDFFQIFGINAKSVGMFEKKVETLDGNKGFIDFFWSGNLIVEHKTYGKNLKKALKQAITYAESLKNSERPKYIIICDFKTIILHDLINSKEYEIQILDLPHNLNLFKPIFYPEIEYGGDDIELNLKASELMADLHDSLKETNYIGHDLEVFIIRILFCLFAEDTGIFNNHQFTNFVKRNGGDNPQRLGEDIQLLFRIMNQKEEERQLILTDEQNSFPYVNGKLFEEQIIPPAFSQSIYNKLVKACHFDWSSISPSIFGSLVQYVIKPEERRNLGAHYTSEKNIKKVIDSLFLNDLWIEFDKSKRSKVKLERLHDKIGKLKFLDPACGCGNFLIVTYKELRLLEYEIIKILKNETDGTRQTHFSFDKLTKIKIDNFYGIEIEEFPSRVAQVAMWFIEHQMNLMYETLDIHQDNLPLKSSLNIFQDNALRMDWKNILTPTDDVYILGNPPFIGSRNQTKNQKNDLKFVFNNMKRVGLLDYVSGWYQKASEYIQNSNIKVAFVSTNSICQGDQVGILWEHLINDFNIKINFAHQYFKWSNEAKNNAAVFVVIIGFSNINNKNKYLYKYNSVTSEPIEEKVNNINPYLIDASNVIIKSEQYPLSDVSNIMKKGSKAYDYGFLTIKNEKEKNELISRNPHAEKFIKKFISAKDFLSNNYRYCLWLIDAKPSDFKNMPLVRERVNNVKKRREKSTDKGINKLSQTPFLFENNQPKNNFLAIPVVSSATRKYIPMDFLNKDIIVTNALYTYENASLYDFGVLTSKMHMLWVDLTCGKLKGDYRYSKKLAYNTFPFPDKNKYYEEISDAANKILEIRNSYESESLADLYDSVVMPQDLLEAHTNLDVLVEKAFRDKSFQDDNERIKFLFRRYEQLISN